MTDHWRAFVGDWDDGDGQHNWTHLDNQGLTWEAARALIRERLDRFRDDDCEPCRVDAAEGVAKLATLPAGDPFEWNVEGDDYVVAPDRIEATT